MQVNVVPSSGRDEGGEDARTLVADFAGRAGGPAGLAEWIEAHADFPSTMVDRIVPATTERDRAVASELIGATDDAPVVGEPFTQWVIEDAFRGARPSWESAGALLVRDVRPYETMKLRLVNGGHSVLAYLGLLAGHETMAEAVGDPELGAFAREVIDTELAPTLPEVPGVDLGDYRRTLFERFANPRIAHRLEQIAAEGARKLPLRLLEPAREHLAAGREPVGICLAVAAWLRWQSTQEASDDLHARVASAVAGAPSPAAAAVRALSVRAVFGDDLPESGVFRELLAGALARLEADGPLGALER